jgi:hypothetical protein
VGRGAAGDRTVTRPRTSTDVRYSSKSSLTSARRRRERADQAERIGAGGADDIQHLPDLGPCAGAATARPSAGTAASPVVSA